MHTQKTLLFVFCLLLMLQAGEEVTEWELTPGQNGNLVVEAILTNEFSEQTIRLSQSYDALNGEAPAVVDAEIFVDVNDTTIPFTHDEDDPGLYRSEAAFAVLNNLVYKLNIDWQGQLYTATSELSSVAPMPEITFLPYENTDRLRFGNFAPLYNANQQAMYVMNIDWSHLTNDETARAKMLFYTFSSIDVSELVRPPQDTVVFPKGSLVIARKFGLNDDFADYLRSLAIETTWRGGVFYGPSASVPTNISNYGLGFFSTCAVITDTLIAE